MAGHAFTWQDGVMTDIGSPGPHGADALDINDRGQVVGEFVTASAHSGAFLWQDGVMTDLGTLGGDYARAEAINERGQVVGQSWTASGETHGFLWEDGTMTDLGDIGTQGRLISINEDGQIMGNRSATGMDQQAFIWHDGVMTDLGTLGGAISLARSADDGGRVVGASDTAAGERHAFIWRDGVMADLGALDGGPFGGAWDVNNRGQVVGESSAVSGYHAFIWQDGVMTDLGTLGGYGMVLDVNERGQAVGVSATASGVEHGVLWTSPGASAAKAAGPEPTKASVRWASAWPYPSEVGTRFTITEFELIRYAPAGTPPADYISFIRWDMRVLQGPSGPSVHADGYLLAGTIGGLAPPYDFPLGTIAIDEAHRTFVVDELLTVSNYHSSDGSIVPAEPVHVRGAIERTVDWRPSPGHVVAVGGDVAVLIDGQLLLDEIPPGFPYFDWAISLPSAPSP